MRVPGLLDRVFPPEQCDFELGDRMVASWQRGEARRVLGERRPAPMPWDESIEVVTFTVAVAS